MASVAQTERPLLEVHDLRTHFLPVAAASRPSMA
jgi:hypothetical protein